MRKILKEHRIKIRIAKRTMKGNVYKNNQMLRKCLKCLKNGDKITNKFKCKSERKLIKKNSKIRNVQINMEKGA